MEDKPGTRTRFERADPILSVADMSISVRYYVDVLGFENADWGSSEFTCVTRDNASIYFSQGDQGGPGTWVWIGVEDVDMLYAEYTSERRHHSSPTTELSLGVRNEGRRSRRARAPVRIGSEIRPSLQLVIEDSGG